MHLGACSRRSDRYWYSYSINLGFHSDVCQDVSRSHEIIELEGIKYTLVELSGEMDSAEFWTQPRAAHDLRTRVLMSLDSDRGSRPGLLQVKIHVAEYHFRSESAYGLKETALAKCIVLGLDS